MRAATANVLWMLLPMLTWVAHFLALYLGATFACRFAPVEQAATHLRWIGVIATLIGVAALLLAARRRFGTQLPCAQTSAFLRRTERMLAALAILAIGLNASTLMTAHPCD